MCLQVCDKRGDPCDELCGGAGCGHCGDALSCDNGAVARAANAIEYSRNTQSLLEEKRAEVDKLLLQAEDAQNLCDMAQGDAQMAFTQAEEAKNQSESTRAELESLIEDISEFMAAQGARPADIRAVSNNALLSPIHVLNILPHRQV